MNGELAFYWFILGAIIYRKVRADLSDPTNWLLAIFYACHSKKCLDAYRYVFLRCKKYSPKNFKREHNLLHDKYERLREVYNVEDNQLQLYAPVSEPNALSAFIQSDGFVHTELRSLALFVALGLVYIAKDRVIDYLAERPEIYTALRVIWLIMQNIVNIAIGTFLTGP